MPGPTHTNWPSARFFAEAIQCPAICFSNPHLRETLPAVDRLGMPLVTSGQFAYVYKLKPGNGQSAYAVRCFRGYLGDREQRYKAIDEHLQSHHIPALAHFAYEAEGILVAGRRYPILFMEWIEGPTLDVYLDEVVTKKEVLLHLADEWAKLVRSLRDAGVAHGDLQHGNIIIEHGQLRLVDLDGMFVPAMAGWTASELGHQHYQHPARDVQQFDANLDNFSALVIYLSLISLAERPQLWAEHHDENLLFTRSDFLEPEASALFAKIKELGPEHRKLAEILGTAVKNSPDAVPCLLDVVDTKTKLPSWMVAPPEVDVVGRTREVPRVEVFEAMPANTQWTPWDKRQRAVPVTPGSPAVQSIFGSLAASVPASQNPNHDPTELWINTLTYARELAGRVFLWWYWGLYILIRIFDGGFFSALLFALISLFIVSLIYGFVRAHNEYRTALASGPLSPGPLPLRTSKTANSPLTGSKAAGHTARLAPPAMTATAPGPLIGNRVLGIYHQPACAWVSYVSQSNRVDFASTTDALAAGYRPCRVCSP